MVRQLVIFLIVLFVGQLFCGTSFAIELGIQFIPDQRNWLLHDVVTGILVLENPSDHKPLDFNLYSPLGDILDCFIISPSGEEIKISESQTGFRVQLKTISLAPRGQVYKPICFAKENGDFILSESGVYHLKIGVNYLDLNSKVSKTAFSPEISFLVDKQTSPPQAYLDVLRGHPNICGVFSYGLTEMTLDEFWGKDFGQYRNSALRFMMYQLWHMHPDQLVYSSGSIPKNYVEENLSRIDSLNLTPSIGGVWIYEKLERMKGNFLSGTHPDAKGVFVSGDLVFF